MSNRIIANLVFLMAACQICAGPTHGQAFTKNDLQDLEARQQFVRQNPRPQEHVSATVEILAEGRVVARGSIDHLGRTTRLRKFEFPRAGVDYTIRVTNSTRSGGTFQRLRHRPNPIQPQTSGRILVDVVVDGYSVMDGEPARNRPWGYVLSPGKSFDIRGWRVDDSTVRTFTVTRPEESLAASKGNVSHVGKIWVRMYREHNPPPSVPRPIAPSRGSNDLRSGYLGSSLARAAGTAAGVPTESRVRRVHFRPGQLAGAVSFSYSITDENQWSETRNPSHRENDATRSDSVSGNSTVR